MTVAPLLNRALQFHRKPSHFIRIGSCCFVVVLALFGITLPAKAEAQNKSQRWLEFSDSQMGVRLNYPSRFKVWTAGDAIFFDARSAVHKKISDYTQETRIDRALNGRIHSNDGLYLLRLTIGKGDFASANRRNVIFEKQGSAMQVAFGRFQNPPALKIATKQWAGYESTIICSTDDANGFHAAGGMCYWSLISDSHSFAIADSKAVNSRDEKAIRSIVRSINFIK